MGVVPNLANTYFLADLYKIIGDVNVNLWFAGENQNRKNLKTLTFRHCVISLSVIIELVTSQVFR